MILQKEQSFMKYVYEQSKWNPKCRNVVFRYYGIWNSEGINTAETISFVNLILKEII